MSKLLERTESPETSIVVPLYNEEENIPELYRRLSLSLQRLRLTYELVLVNDGSRDGTAKMIDALQEKDPQVMAIHLSRNFGHQAAICAGIDHAQGRAVILMDGDLQDPPEVLGQFIQLWREGHDVVYAVRQNRKEGSIKRAGYFLFYRLLHAMSDLDIPIDSGDFCLMDRKVVDVLVHLPERLRFVRGLRTFVGFRQIGLCYERAERKAGKPKYTFRALLGLATDGIISFSSYPLHLATCIGLLSVIVAILLAIWVFIDAIYKHTAPHGWASLTVVVLFMGAIQLLGLGIVGEYVRRIFIETKGRPTYIVDHMPTHAQYNQASSKLHVDNHAENLPATVGLPPNSLEPAAQEIADLKSARSEKASS